MFFNNVLVDTLNHHHHVEDDFMFPKFERMLNKPSAMEENVEGHEKFLPAFELFARYVKETLAKPSEYDGIVFRQLIENFAVDLCHHLQDEIPTIRDLCVLDSKELMKVWKEAHRLATKDTVLWVDGPFILGCQDKEFRIDGTATEFPAVPWVLERVVEKWVGRRHAGAWRFCPSDLAGRRRLLEVNL